MINEFLDSSNEPMQVTDTPSKLISNETESKGRLLEAENNAMLLEDVKLPSKMKRRGRPKGLDVTVVGLRRKKKTGKRKTGRKLQ